MRGESSQSPSEFRGDRVKLAAVVYILCFLASLFCTILLLRSFMRSRTQLLLWSGLCFGGMALNNCVLLFRRIVFPNLDLFWLGTLPLLAGLFLLLYGLISETR